MSTRQKYNSNPQQAHTGSPQGQGQGKSQAQYQTQPRTQQQGQVPYPRHSQGSGSGSGSGLGGRGQQQQRSRSPPPLVIANQSSQKSAKGLAARLKAKKKPARRGLVRRKGEKNSNNWGLYDRGKGKLFEVDLPPVKYRRGKDQSDDEKERWGCAKDGSPLGPMGSVRGCAIM